MKQIYDNKDIGETIDKSFDAGIKEGYRRCKEQMMKKAVEVDYDCQYCAPAIFLDRNLEGIKDGDRVRIIVCKKED